MTNFNLKETIKLFADSRYQKPIDDLKSYELHNAVAEGIMAYISEVWKESKGKDAEKRRAYYLSAEFLVGRSIFNNILSTDIGEELESVL